MHVLNMKFLRIHPFLRIFFHPFKLKRGHMMDISLTLTNETSSQYHCTCISDFIHLFFFMKAGIRGQHTLCFTAKINRTR